MRPAKGPNPTSFWTNSRPTQVKGLHPTSIAEAFMRAAAECEKILETMAVPVGLDERARLVDAARGPRRKTKYSRETVDPRSVDRGNESEKERSSVRRWTSGDGGSGAASRAGLRPRAAREERGGGGSS